MHSRYFRKQNHPLKMLTSFEMKQLLCYNFMMDEKEKKIKRYLFERNFYILPKNLYPTDSFGDIIF